ncbi:MAG: exo-alpha-sialidase [Bacteroidota bacterium]
MKSIIYFFLIILLLSTSVYSQKTEQFIFPLQNTYVHASSIVELPNGDLLACWFEGDGERNSNNNRINGARLRKGKKEWSDKFLMADYPDHPDCNPVLFVDRNEQLYLFWVIVRANRWESSVIEYRTSTNYKSKGAPKWNWQDVMLLKPGEEFAETIKKSFDEREGPDYSWAEYARKYEDMLYEAAVDKKKRTTGWMPRIHPLQLENGRILLPLYSDGYNLSLVAISDDDGKSWQSSLPIVSRGGVQPSLVENKEGNIIAFLRDNGDSPGRVMISESKDNGYTWTHAKKSEVPNPGTSVEVIKLKSGNWLMVYNDVEDGRNSFAVSISSDEGKTWGRTKHLEKVDKGNGRFAYPSVIQNRKGIIHITYSYHVGGNKSIKHVSFNENWITE